MRELRKPTSFMRYLPRECKRSMPTGGFQKQLEANGDLVADAKMCGGKGCENLTRREDLS
jgi:hypothetical protein